MTKKSAVRVYTEQYEFSHGKKPRGDGRWAFYFDGETDPRFFDGTYTEARDQAKSYAAFKGVTQVKVGS